METLHAHSSLKQHEPPRKIGILGGTFNPVHRGHIEVAKKIVAEFSLSCCYLMLSGNPPHKPARVLASPEDRYEMLRLATENEPLLLPCDIEMNRPGKIYTVDTLHALRHIFQNDRLYYIIGADTLCELEGWRDAPEVFSLVSFISMDRVGVDKKSATITAIRLREQYAADILLSAHTGPDISSSHIRTLIRQNKDVSGYLDRKVEDYIIKHGLYK